MRYRLTILLFAITSALVVVCSVSADGVTLNVLYMVQSGYQPDAIIRRTHEYNLNNPDTAFVHFVEYRHLWQHVMLGINDGRYDVVLTDIIWMDRLVRDGAIVPAPPRVADRVREGMVGYIVHPFEFDREIYAVPFFMDLQLFFSNMNLVRAAGFTGPPETTEELETIARAIKRRGLVPYPIFLSLREEEILVCQLALWTGAFGGSPDPLRSDGRIQVDTPEAARTLSWLQRLLREGLLNPYSLHADEVLAADVFLAGDAAFTTNWIFLLGKTLASDRGMEHHGQPSLIPVSGRYYHDEPQLSPPRSSETGATAHDRSVPSTSVNGFQGFSVLSSSPEPEAAWNYVEFLTSADFHINNPVELAPWSDIWEENPGNDPHLALKIDQLYSVRERPYHERYMEISSILRRWVHTILVDGIDPEQGLREAQVEIDQLM